MLIKKLAVIAAGFLLIGCVTSRSYHYSDRVDRYAVDSVSIEDTEYLRVYFYELDFDYIITRIFTMPFFTMHIYPHKDVTGIKNLTINSIDILGKNNIYDLKQNVYFINILDYTNSNFQRQFDLDTFYSTGSIEINLVEDFSGVFIWANNPGMNYFSESEIIVSLDITVEIENGDIEHIKREFTGRKKFVIYNFIEILFGQ